MLFLNFDIGCGNGYGRCTEVGKSWSSASGACRRFKDKDSEIRDQAKLPDSTCGLQYCVFRVPKAKAKKRHTNFLLAF